MVLYKQVHNDWFVIRGTRGIKHTTRPGDILDTSNPPQGWMDSHRILQERGWKDVDARGSFQAEIQHWAKGRNPIFVVTSQRAIDEEKALRERAEAAEKPSEENKKTSRKKKVVESEEDDS